MSTQPELPISNVTPDDVARLRAWLRQNGWQTRRQIAMGLMWSERKIRQVAEALGAEVVRGQNGFKLTDQIHRDDLPAAVQAADAAISQGKMMISYGFRLRKLLHGVVG